MTYFKRYTSFVISSVLLFSCYNIGCGKKDSGTQSTIQHGVSTKFEGEAPSVHKKSMVDEETTKEVYLLKYGIKILFFLKRYCISYVNKGVRSQK